VTEQFLNPEQALIVEQGGTYMWVLERPILKKMLARHVSSDTSVIARSIKSDGIKPATYLLSGYFWTALAVPFGWLGAILLILASSSNAMDDLGALCLVISGAGILIGIIRLSMAFRNGASFKFK